jgi:hypothetical protein
LYEQKELPVLMVTERALVFQKIRVRFCRNLVLYSIPESPDIIEEFPEFMNLNMWEKIKEHRLRLLKSKSIAKDSEMTEQ